MRLIGVYVNGIKALLNCMKEDQKHRRDSTIESLANLVVGKNVAAFSPLHKTIKKLAKIIGKDLKEIHVAWSLENEKKIAANDLAKAQKRVDEAAKKKKEEEESEKKRKKEEKAKGKKKKDDHS
jgi:ribosomal protein L12E/L44/L45/RPP1/RPP2